MILTGIAGNICVLFTANDAYMRDLKIFAPADCIVSNTPPDNDHALRQIHTVLKGNLTESSRLAFRGTRRQTGVQDMKTELDKFYGLIEEIKIAMMTTRRPDGHLESRAMANQKQAGGADLWFVTAEGSGKLRDIEHDPHVNLAYYKPGSYEWVSASGIASRVARPRQDPRAVRARLEGVVRAGRRSPPRHAGRSSHRADRHRRPCRVFLEVNKPKPVVLFELAKGWLTGERVEAGETHELRAPHR